MTTQSTTVKSTDGVDRVRSLTFGTSLEDSKFFFTFFDLYAVNNSA